MLHNNNYITNTQLKNGIKKLRDLLEDRLTQAPHGDSFLASIPYYLLTGRHGIKIFKNKESTCVTCIHPNNLKKILIFPETTGQNTSLIIDALNYFTNTQLTVELSRFPPSLLNDLEQKLKKNNQGLIDISLKEEKNISLDWLYPLQILDTQHVADMHGPQFRNIRNKYKQITHEYVKIRNLHDINYRQMLFATLKFWEGMQIYAGKNHITNSDLEYYHALETFISDIPDLIDGIFIEYHGRPIGFSIWDKSLPQQSNLLANLVDISTTDISEFQLVETCKRLFKQGYTRLNRGGSETHGLHNFKKKFSPIQMIPLKSARVTYKRSHNNSSIHTISPLNKPNIFNNLTSF